MEFGIKVLGIWLGILSRMMMPFLRKLYKGKGARFDFKYLRISFAVLVLSVIITFLIFPKLEVAASRIISLESGFKLFCLSFGFGFGFNSIVIELSQWFKKNELQKAKSQG